MDMSQGLSQSLRQEQTLSPQMLQALALLPLPIMELQQHIRKEIEENPALEIPDSEFSSATPEPVEKTLDDRMDDADSSDYEGQIYSSTAEGEEASDRNNMFLENAVSEDMTLQDHLVEQLGLTCKSEKQRELGELIISNLDRNGFFILPLNELFKDRQLSEKELEKTLLLIQSFDPPGVCVPDFRSSLILQASMKGLEKSDLAIFSDLVNLHLEQMRLGKNSEVAKQLHISEQDLDTFYSLLKTLTPYPGKDWGPVEASYVVPEFSIHAKNGTLTLEMNRGSMPNLEISPDFTSLSTELKKTGDKEAITYINDSIRKANQLISQVDLRFKTIYNAGLALMDLQADFFFHGPRHLKPLTLKVVADRIGVHETTMSRLSQSKWIDTDWGLFQLKYFFTQGVESAAGDGTVISRNVVKDMIRDILAENKGLSDQKISDLLLTKGIKAARRTVSKYRAELNIDSSYVRN